LTAAADATSYTDNGLDTSKSYKYVIYAKNGAGWSAGVVSGVIEF